MNAMRHMVLASVLASFAFVAACGGGGQEANAPGNAAPSASAAASAAPATSDASAASAAPSASAAPAASAAPTAAAPAMPSGPPGPGDWDDATKWTHDAKLAYMKSDVMPKMGALFKDFDAKHYTDMKCKACHGAGVDDGSFKMPNPDLPKLDIKGQLKAEKAKHPKAVEFMMKKVEVQMAALLGKQPYDPKTKSGFGCTACHTMK